MKAIFNIQSNSILRSMRKAVMATVILLSLVSVSALAQYSHTITQQPQDVTVQEGDPASFKVVASDNYSYPPTTYKWEYSPDNSNWYPIDDMTHGSIYGGYNSDELVISSVPLTLNGYYYHVICIWDGMTIGEKTSNPARLTVIPSIISHPADSHITEGDNTSFSVTVSPPTEGLTYEWWYRPNSNYDFKIVTNGGIYSDAMTSTLTLTDVPIEYDGYEYYCIVYGPNRSYKLTSNTAVLTVDKLILPAITSDPVDVTITEGSDASFSVTTAFDDQITYKYQWQYRPNVITDFTDVPNSGIYSDATTSTLTLTNVPVMYSKYQYRCKVVAPQYQWTDFSNYATLTVATPPKITTTSIPNGEQDKPYSTTLTATGTTPITWSITAGSLPAGLSLNPTTGVISGTPTKSGQLQFTVKASNSVGSDTKQFGFVIAEPPPPSVIEITSPSSSSSTPFCTTEDYLSVPFNKIENDHPMKYSLRFSEDAKAAGFKDTSFDNLPSDGIFKIDVPKGASSNLYSATVIITCEGLDKYKNEYPITFTVVNNGIAIVSQPATYQAFCGSATLALTVNVAGAVNSYQWFKDGQAIAGATSNEYVAEKAGNYYVEVMGNCGKLRSSVSVVTPPASTLGTISVRTKWGNVLYVENASDVYQRFQWYHNGSPINGATFVYLSEKDGFLGDYFVRCYKADGSFDETCSIGFNVSTKSSAAIVSPTVVNPNDVLNINIADSNFKSDATVEIYSLLGTKVYSKTIATPLATIKPDFKQKGNYFILIKLPSGEAFSEKIIVK